MSNTLMTITNNKYIFLMLNNLFIKNFLFLVSNINYLHYINKQNKGIYSLY